MIATRCPSFHAGLSPLMVINGNQLNHLTFNLNLSCGISPTRRGMFDQVQWFAWSSHQMFSSDIQRVGGYTHMAIYQGTEFQAWNAYSFDKNMFLWPHYATLAIMFSLFRSLLFSIHFSSLGASHSILFCSIPHYSGLSFSLPFSISLLSFSSLLYSVLLSSFAAFSMSVTLNK